MQRRAKARKPRNPPRRGSESSRLNTLNTDRSGARLKSLDVSLRRRSEKSSMRYGQQLKRGGSSKGRRLIKNETGQTPLRVNLAPSGRKSIRRGLWAWKPCKLPRRSRHSNRSETGQTPLRVTLPPSKRNSTQPESQPPKPPNPPPQRPSTHSPSH